MMEHATQRATTLITSDKYASIEIAVLGDEGVVQRGKHQKLLATAGHYKKLYEVSQNGIIG